MGHGIENPLEHPEVRVVNGRGYLVSYVVSLLLMTLALGFVTQPALMPWALVGLSAAAAVTVLVQIILLFQLDFSETQVWTTVSFLLIVPLFIIAVGLTMWMFNALDARTMLAGMMMH